MSTRLDPLEHLERSDKWYLGGGGATMFAPAFPRFLDHFGFWDEAYFVDVRLDRLFTLIILGEDGRPLALRREGRRWTPDTLTQTYYTEGLRIREDKVVTSSDTFGSRVTIYNDGRHARTLHFILWSLQDRSAFRPGARNVSAEQVERLTDAVVFTHTVDYGDEPFVDRPAENERWGERNRPTAPGRKHGVHVVVGADRPPLSICVNMAERTDTAPDWQVSVVPEKFENGALAEEFRANSADEGHLHICLHYRVEAPVGTTRAIQFGVNVGLDRDRAVARLRQELASDLAAESRAHWNDYYAGVPYFECSDPFIQRYYWYRWYGLRLLTVDVGGHQIEGEDGVRFPHPCVFEGIGGFRSHISYSAQCHVLEASWMHDPRLACGCIEGLFAAQENSGYLPGHLYLFRPTRGFYHANWGAVALQLYQITTDLAFVDRIYPALSRYADYFERERDREDSHLYDIVDQGETGQEYMSRYLFVDSHADDWRRIQLKGVDATVYIYQLQRALSTMAALLGKAEEASVWERKAEATRAAVRECMWDPDTEFFYDVDARTGRRSPYKAACGFYPFLCDIAGPEHLAAIRKHLLNPEEFWTEWPVPASSVDDPFFSATAEWRGRRMSCPWNGRVWPMTNAHVCEALANAARMDPDLRSVAAQLITRFIHLMFYDGDPARPNCFEHYNPFTGTPSTYRGIDDYQHSWVVDLIVKYLVGVRPNGSKNLVVDPLPFDIDRFAISGVQYRGHSVDVSWDRREGFVVRLDGVERHRSVVRERVELPLD